MKKPVRSVFLAALLLVVLVPGCARHYEAASRPAYEEYAYRWPDATMTGGELDAYIGQMELCLLALEMDHEDIVYRFGNAYYDGLHASFEAQLREAQIYLENAKA